MTWVCILLQLYAVHTVRMQILERINLIRFFLSDVDRVQAMPISENVNKIEMLVDF